MNVLLLLSWQSLMLTVQAPDSRRIIGNLGGAGAVVIVAPDTVQARVQFAITVNTFGSSSCLRPDGVDQVVTELVATITPYDRRPTAATPCTADFVPHPHPVRLVFGTVGQAKIRVRGYQPGGKELVFVERAVVVR